MDKLQRLLVCLADMQLHLNDGRCTTSVYLLGLSYQLPWSEFVHASDRQKVTLRASDSACVCAYVGNV